MSPTPALPQQSDQIARHESKGRLSRRTCMVTGGTSGIGYAIAERFLQEGASTIILVGRSEERLRGAAEKLAPSTNLSTISQKVQLLVGDVGEAGGWMRELEQNMVNVDVLVNAAGISVSNLLTKLDLSDISSVLRTNLEGAILTSRAFLRAAIRSRVRNRKASPSEGIPASKCIINISSLLALKAGTGAVPYAASKAGLLGLTRALAAENATSFRNMAIRCNAIVPGYIATPMIEGFSPGEVERLTSLIPLQRFGDPKEIADAAVFLAQNEYANNCVLNLDGGLSAV
ncbi:PKS/NRPS-like protein biosynthetic cluster [Penicillium ucsense]|uniref:PKS/NRPS-like protein biosynthetic cluster n=1 Tax=Penicillium ucsense TaxID=2839758 RepID=A0A8J8W6Y2_9EURO|nr:PKS/NRPS-like protein biosynthetic cluster [Penicillium ucsense]KAF7735490.1 PKS/NRPS-like protein biosynthetic cluster [Penicillium ucsense]